MTTKKKTAAKKGAAKKSEVNYKEEEVDNVFKIVNDCNFEFKKEDLKLAKKEFFLIISFFFK